MFHVKHINNDSTNIKIVVESALDRDTQENRDFLLTKNSHCQHTNEWTNERMTAEV